jgi:four helix bundle protein
MTMVRTFRDLIAWQRAMSMCRAIYESTARMPDTERFGLTSQMRRAAVSVPSNIAEDHGRQSRPDYLRHLRIARGSLAEVSTQYELASSMGMIEARQPVLDIVAETDRVLQGLINSLQRLSP